MSVQPGFQAMEQRRRFQLDTSENSARYASSFVTFNTTGWGEFQSPDCQYFDTTFIRPPSISHSFFVDGDDLIDGRFPRITAGVYRWALNERGFYIGAWLVFVVETMGMQFQKTYVLPTAVDGNVGVVNVKVPADPDPGYKIVHTFTFTGVAMKSLPSAALADLQ